VSFNVAAVRRQFPILSEIIDGQPVHYLDNGASAQTPDAVLDVVRAYETTGRANVLRGVHRLAERATEAYENARIEVAQARHFDFVIINALFETALFDLKAIVHSQRLKYAALQRSKPAVFAALDLS